MRILTGLIVGCLLLTGCSIRQMRLDNGYQDGWSLGNRYYDGTNPRMPAYAWGFHRGFEAAKMKHARDAK